MQKRGALYSFQANSARDGRPMSQRQVDLKESKVRFLSLVTYDEEWDNNYPNVLDNCRDVSTFCKLLDSVKCSDSGWVMERQKKVS